MKPFHPFLKTISIILGLASIGLLTACFFLFETLRPSMVELIPMTSSELNSFNWAGICLVVLFLFFCSSLFLLVKSLKWMDKVRPSHYLLIGSMVVTFLMVFADFALLGDIVKQYKHGLAQPEWCLVYPIMAFQLLTVGMTLWFLLYRLRKPKMKVPIRIDSNVILAVHFIGVICGLMGLGLVSLGFFIPRGWSFPVHTLLSSAILLVPYLLLIGYWILLKLHDEKGQFFDEKQWQDLGRSALLTLAVCTILMTALFFANIKNLNGMLSQLWLPLYLFSTLFTFSIGNLLQMVRQLD
jgi:hypothetical protein